MIVINDHGEYIGGAQLKTGPHDGVWEATSYPLFLLRKCLESSNLDFDLTIGDDGLLRSWTAKRGLSFCCMSDGRSAKRCRAIRLR
ncbi:hypothetical protein PGTUg99_031825 [Puccinia graminis f. sp. tritici]|uniref:Uncharacterized protein n=1 Tax=Puccinia graminis f. sp. tritici TaxID=56615 RepID=A0A5B0NHL2_PUCGR|nr:hypothetical protein PGTUg99_031825 [Puccinia graminis f. sp. tritici]